MGPEWTKTTNLEAVGRPVAGVEESDHENVPSFFTVVGYRYSHPTLGETVLDPEILELAYLSCIVQTASQRPQRGRRPLLKFDFHKEAFPRSSATGNRPYAVVQPELRPSECPPVRIHNNHSATTMGGDGKNRSDDCPTLLTCPQVIGYARRCARCLLGTETNDLREVGIIDFMSERLDLITDYFLWCDSLVVQEWTLPILLRSLPFGFRRYYSWRRRKEWEAKFAVYYGQSFFSVAQENIESLLLGLLSQIVRFVVQSLRTASCLSGSDSPSILDGVVFSHLSVLLSTPVSDHDGLASILTESSVKLVLKEYCARINSITSSNFWVNRDTFLIGFDPSAAPYPNNPYSARSEREQRCKRVKQLRTPDLDVGKQEDEEDFHPSCWIRAMRWTQQIGTVIYRHATLPVVVRVDPANPNMKVSVGLPEARPPPTSPIGENRLSAVNPQMFVGISILVLLGFVLSGKSPLQLK